MKRLQIIDSTTITLFSNLLFKGVGRHPKTGKKKGGIKVHTVIHANEGVPSDIKFSLDASVGKTLLRKALTLKLTATDIFNSANSDWSMRTGGIRVDKRQSYDRRGPTFSLTYNFQPMRSLYKGSAAAEAEIQRL